MNSDEKFGEIASQYHRRHVPVKATDSIGIDKDLIAWAKEEEKEPEHSKDSLAGSVAGVAGSVAGSVAGVAGSVKTGLSAGSKIGEKIAKPETGGVVDEVKSPATRGHEGGLIGGPARAEVLTSSEKENIARKGGYARWGEAKGERE